MAEDPLAQFRRQPGARPAAEAPAAAQPERGEYRASGNRDNQRRSRLDIRCKDGMAHAVGYNFIVEIVYDRRGYTGLVVVLSTMLVSVKGRNLRPIVDALKLGTCEFIQEFDPGEFDVPEDDTAPFVHSIEVRSAAQQRQERQEA